ncbi:MAG: DNA mismatch repair endonuclease MutL [Oscillospiraceae bacterium]|jgi:DNA mismatch repair protein MutL|nr:DNA mismatch repair endonuclease MutL [Oscillospiraceae bacterium]
MPIRVLDKSVAELIAAGEVVEHPASVAKELIENSIDAGAKTITVEIKNGGVTFLRVSDDGTGIPFEEAPVAFLRHATSKVAVSEDLASIYTLGFRGEALASVSAVSRVSLLTKTRGEETGTSYKIEGGAEIEHTNAGCPDGTTIIIRDLFFNTPARLKFLKKDVSEGNFVQSVTDKAALINPRISFKFIRDNKLIRVTPGDGNPYSAIYAVLGKGFAGGLITAEHSQNGVGVSGYISSPLFCRGSRALQHFYVNSRYIRSASCAAAIEEGYKNSVMTGKFPVCVLNITVNPSDVDVNVHPAKTQVRFVNERAVFDAVYFAVKNALLNMNAANTAEIGVREPEGAKPPVVGGEKVFADETRYTPAFAPPASYGFSSGKTAYTAERSPDMSRYRHLTGEAFVKKEKPAVKTNVLVEYEEEQLRVVGEIFNTYIICERGENIILIDKHAADERARFNELKDELKTHSQLLAESAEVRLDAEGYDAVINASKELAEIGIGLASDTCGNADFTVKVTALPSLFDAGEAVRIISRMAETLKKGAGANTDKTGLYDEILRGAACKAAIKAGDKTAPGDLEQLARRVIDDAKLRYCPHGRPVAVTLAKRDFEKMFKRIP